MSETLAYAAIGIWVVDFIWTLAGKWYMSVQVDQEVTIGPHPSTSEIGIDAGIICFAAFSVGTMIEGVHSFRKHAERLAREQRKLKNKQKGSSNYRKQKKKISRIHHQIFHVRSDFSISRVPG